MAIHKRENIEIIPINLVSSSRIRRRIEFSCLVGERERVRVYWDLGFMKVFLCTIISPYFFIVKFLRRLRGGRQFSEPRKSLRSLCVLVI